jgi:hypothetical protein
MKASLPGIVWFLLTMYWLYIDLYWFILILHCLACPCYWLIWFNVVLRRIAMSIGEFQWNTSWTLLAGGPHTLKGKDSGHQLSLLSLRSSTEHFLWHATFAKRADWEMSGKSRPGPDVGTKRDKLCVDVEIVVLGFALISGANFRFCKILQRVGSWTPPWVAHCYKHRLKARRTRSFWDLSTCSENEGHKARRVHSWSQMRKVFRKKNCTAFEYQ